MFHRCPDWFAKVGYWWLSYWESGTIVSSKGFFSLPTFLFPFSTALSLALFTCLAWWASKARWPQLLCQALMSAQLTAFQSFVMKHFDFSIEKYRVWALWMTLPESLNGRWIRSLDLNFTVLNPLVSLLLDTICCSPPNVTLVFSHWPSSSC